MQLQENLKLGPEMGSKTESQKVFLTDNIQVIPLFVYRMCVWGKKIKSFL